MPHRHLDLDQRSLCQVSNSYSDAQGAEHCNGQYCCGCTYLYSCAVVHVYLQAQILNSGTWLDIGLEPSPLAPMRWCVARPIMSCDNSVDLDFCRVQSDILVCHWSRFKDSAANCCFPRRICLLVAMAGCNHSLWEGQLINHR